MEQGWRCDHRGAGVVYVMDSPKGAALGVVLGILKGRQPQSLTLHRDLFSLSFVEGRDGVADDFHALFPLRLGRNSLWHFTFPAAQEAFPPVQKPGLPLFPREANCKVKVEHLKCKEK